MERKTERCLLPSFSVRPAFQPLGTMWWKVKPTPASCPLPSLRVLWHAHFQECAHTAQRDHKLVKKCYWFMLRFISLLFWLGFLWGWAVLPISGSYLCLLSCKTWFLHTYFSVLSCWTLSIKEIALHQWQCWSFSRFFPPLHPTFCIKFIRSLF